MGNLVEQCIDSSCELAEIPKGSLKKVPIPYLGESNDPKAMEVLVEWGIDMYCKIEDLSPNDLEKNSE